MGSLSWALSWLSVGAVGLSPILGAWMVQLIIQAMRRGRHIKSRRTPTMTLMPANSAAALYRQARPTSVSAAGLGDGLCRYP